MTPLILQNFWATSISSFKHTPPQDINDLNIFWLFCLSRSSENKNVEHFFFPKNFSRARAKKIKHPEIWGLCLLSLQYSPPPIDVVETKCRSTQIRVNFTLAAEAAFLTTFFCTYRDFHNEKTRGRNKIFSCTMISQWKKKRHFIKKVTGKEKIIHKQNKLVIHP